MPLRTRNTKPASRDYGSVTDLPPPLAEYVELVKSFNPGGPLKLYPGSPLLALKLMREQDRMRLFEMHPADNDLLQKNFRGHAARVTIQKTDGFKALKALLPPPPKRALVLIDPPYEDKQDYRHVLSALNEGLKRFATGMFALWYPQLQRVESGKLPGQLKLLTAKSWLHVTLTVHGSTDTDVGMRGSGLFVLNPPWRLQAVLQEVMPYLVTHLGQDDKAGFVLEYHEQSAG